jgi:dihydrofolate reductase
MDRRRARARTIAAEEATVGRLILYIATSLDGFIADAAGGVGWLEAFNQPGEDYGYQDLLARVGALIVGGTTYRQVLTFGPWPYAGRITHVVTRQPLGNPPDPAIRAWSGDLSDLVAEIRTASDRDIWLVGGAQVIAPLHNDGLIDDYDIAVMPIVLGSGIPLFAGIAGPHRLRLVEALPYPTGVVRLRYGRE